MEKPKSKKLTCELCPFNSNKIYTSIDHLEQHVIDVHLEDKESFYSSSSSNLFSKSSSSSSSPFQFHGDHSDDADPEEMVVVKFELDSDYDSNSESSDPQVVDSNSNSNSNSQIKTPIKNETVIIFDQTKEEATPVPPKFLPKTQSLKEPNRFDNKIEANKSQTEIFPFFRPFNNHSRPSDRNHNETNETNEQTIIEISDDDDDDDDDDDPSSSDQDPFAEVSVPMETELFQKVNEETGKQSLIDLVDDEKEIISEEKGSRKRAQNRIAATRYRQKQNRELTRLLSKADSLFREHQILLEKKKELRKDVNTIKQLLREIISVRRNKNAN